jgi:putative ABC transport system permease protein
MTRAGVARVFATEYGLIGAVAGLLGASAGSFLAWGVLTRGMEAPWRLDLASPALAAAGSVLLAVGAGLLASIRAFQARPIEVLRRE